LPGRSIRLHLHLHPLQVPTGAKTLTARSQDNNARGALAQYRGHFGQLIDHLFR
jgi:hypothetical protein